MNARDLPAYVEHFRHRVVQDALAEATAVYWERRARDFDAVGTAQCDEIARACRNRAAVAQYGRESHDVELIVRCLDEAL